MWRSLLICYFVLGAHQVMAQYFQFSQYNYTAQRISPAAPASSDYAKLGFIFRNQRTGGDNKLSSNMLSVSYPLVHKSNGRRWSGIGMTLLDDRTGGVYSTTEGTLSYAINVFLNEHQSLALGVKGAYLQRKIDISGFTTGMQYVPDRGFDGAAASGEDLENSRISYASLSAGLSWQKLDDEGIQVAHASGSLFDFNQPSGGFIRNDKLRATMVFAGGFRMFKRNNFSVFPEMLYTRGHASNVMNAGFVTRCDVMGTGKEKPFYVDLITKYAVGRSAILGLQFHNENFSFGASYDWPMGGGAANLGAFEIAIELKSLVVASLKNKYAKNKKKNQRKPTTTVAKKAPAKKPTPAKVLSDTLRQKAAPPPKKDLSEKLHTKRDSVVANAKAGQISHDPFVLDKVILHFNFKFNSSDLDETSTTYLDDLIVALQQDEHLNIKLTGHTDNVGSKTFNNKLSYHRANSIKEYIVAQGIDEGRIAVEGKGMSMPLNENKTEEERAKNRRVELTILYKE